MGRREKDKNGLWMYRGKHSNNKPVVMWVFGESANDEWNQVFQSLHDRGLPQQKIWDDANNEDDDDGLPCRITKVPRLDEALHKEIEKLSNMSPEIIDALNDNWDTEDFYKNIKRYQERQEEEWNQGKPRT